MVEHMAGLKMMSDANRSMKAVLGACLVLAIGAAAGSRSECLQPGCGGPALSKTRVRPSNAPLILTLAGCVGAGEKEQS